MLETLRSFDISLESNSRISTGNKTNIIFYLQQCQSAFHYLDIEYRTKTLIPYIQPFLATKMISPVGKQSYLETIEFTVLFSTHSTFLKLFENSTFHRDLIECYAIGYYKLIIEVLFIDLFSI
jgi:hypothetical protein